MIEPGKVIHVRVRDEHVRNPHELPRRQHAQVAKIEEQRAAFVAEVDIEPGITERFVDEARLEEVPHVVTMSGRPPWFPVGTHCKKQNAAALAAASWRN